MRALELGPDLTLSLRQRVILGGSIALVGGTVWLFTHLMGSDYKTLYSGMAPADALRPGREVTVGGETTSIQGARRSGRWMRLRLTGIAERQAAAGLRGEYLLVREDDLGALCKEIERSKTDVVTSTGIIRARISEPSDKPNA